MLTSIQTFNNKIVEFLNSLFARQIPRVNFKKSGYKDAVYAWIYFWQFEKDYTHKVKHPFHLVEPSLLPIFASFWLALNLGYIICSSHFTSRSPFIVCGLLIGLVGTLLSWLSDVNREEVVGFHTLEVQAGFRLGILLFILSEVMLFVAFFWAFFHFSISPAVSIGLCWPMEGLPYFAWTKIPLINTALLFSSGIDITIAHESALLYDKERTRKFWSRVIYSIPSISKIFNLDSSVSNWQRVSKLDSYINRILLVDILSLQGFSKVHGMRLMSDALIRGFIFLVCQYLEYFFSPFSISDGVYGSVFFMATGLHGLHVIVGFSALCYCGFVKLELDENGHRYWQHAVGFEGSIWYWHFVDVVWLFLFLVVYWWSSN